METDHLEGVSERWSSGDLLQTSATICSILLAIGVALPSIAGSWAGMYKTLLVIGVFIAGEFSIFTTGCILLEMVGCVGPDTLGRLLWRSGAASLVFWSLVPLVLLFELIAAGSV